MSAGQWEALALWRPYLSSLPKELLPRASDGESMFCACAADIHLILSFKTSTLSGIRQPVSMPDPKEFCLQKVVGDPAKFSFEAS